jgi:hypothetical protein
MTTTAIDLPAVILSRLEVLEDLAADAGLRLALASTALDAGLLADGLADVGAAAERLRHLLGRLPAEDDARAALDGERTA